MPSIDLDLTPLPLALIAPPLIVWAWGHALAQLATGIERLARTLRTLDEEQPR